jgi:hypothetical protein
MTTAADLEASQNLQDLGIKREFKNVYSRLDQFQADVLDQFVRLELRIANSEARMLNGRAVSSWQDIYAVGVFTPSATGVDVLRKPERFPNKVRKFWNLRQPKNREYIRCFV